MNVVHLLASPFVGGPERQALGLAEALRPRCQTVFLSFAERGLSWPFLSRARELGFEAHELRANAPWLFHAAAEVAAHLGRVGARVLLCSGYKPDVVGWLAGQRTGVPALAIAHGWTAATWKVRLNEGIDRWVMRRLAGVVAVSEAMAERVRRAGVPRHRVTTIRNAVQTRAFDDSEHVPGSGHGENVPPRISEARARLRALFPTPPDQVVVTAGRLSPEKGFDILVAAAAGVLRLVPSAGFVVFGDGPLRSTLEAAAAAAGLSGRFIFAGFRTDVERYLPGADLAVLSSRTEGLPVFVLEAMAARLPVLATAVGGTPEVVVDGVTGFLVPPEDADALARRLAEILQMEPAVRRDLGMAGRQRVDACFSFASQAAQYQDLFARLANGPSRNERDGARQGTVASGRGA